MRELLDHGDKPIFSEAMTKFLITESGGHPYLAQLLASEAFYIIKYDNEIKPSEFLTKLKDEIRRNDSLDNFNIVIDKIISAGFNPLTWERNGEGEQLNVEVYKNMIPRYTSNIFKDWLIGYLEKQNQN